MTSAADYRKSLGLSPPGSDLVRFRSETEFQTTVVRWWDALELVEEAFMFHPANGGKRDLVTAAILQAMGVRPGVADLGFLLPRGRMAWLELKQPAGKASEAQKRFAALCRRLDHPHAIAKSFEEVAAALASFGICFREPWAARKVREGG
ncbi:MAG: VRR-NUC domain-containing protein [Thermoanaerobaculia bacterium]